MNYDSNSELVPAWQAEENANEIEAYLHDAPAPLAIFSVRDQQSANWVLKKIHQAEEYAAQVREWASIETQRAERTADFFRSRFGEQLKNFAADQLAGQKTKTLSLPAGKLAFRKQPARLVVDDEVAALRWAKVNLPAAVVVKESVAKSELAAEFKSNGVVPDGCHVEDESQAFSIK